MKWFVYYCVGSCNYGDHTEGLSEFDTEEAARAFIAEQRKDRHEMSCSLIRGETVEDYGD